MSDKINQLPIQVIKNEIKQYKELINKKIQFTQNDLESFKDSVYKAIKANSTEIQNINKILTKKINELYDLIKKRNERLYLNLKTEFNERIKKIENDLHNSKILLNSSEINSLKNKVDHIFEESSKITRLENKIQKLEEKLKQYEDIFNSIL